jgi:DNA invertase Pin-like site-specific DNA recombinase
MRAAGYIRVSSGSQVEGHSLGAQERLFRELCGNRGWDPMIVYRDEGRSAKSDSIKKRPAFKQLLDDAKKGLFDTVVVHTFDRWSRNLRIGLEGLKILGENNIGFVSIAEQIDTSNPTGRFQLNILGSFSELFSDMLGVHIRKGQEERALKGRHTGGIPFGYESCYVKEGGIPRQTCDPEHLGGVHIHPKEGPMVTELFRRYSTGTTSTSDLAMWLNEQGFRTRNTHSLKGPDGVLRPAEPRLFTNASVRVILHNCFYWGMIKHQGKQLAGAHEPLVSKELFDLVQAIMRKNSGRSSTLRARPHRQYLLKGIIRCAYCGMPMWAQTYYNGHRYYREHRASRGHDDCAAKGGSIPCHIADEQVGRLIAAIELGPDWHEEVLARISL